MKTNKLSWIVLLVFTSFRHIAAAIDSLELFCPSLLIDLAFWRELVTLGLLVVTFAQSHTINNSPVHNVRFARLDDITLCYWVRDILDKIYLNRIIDGPEILWWISTLLCLKLVSILVGFIESYVYMIFYNLQILP